MKTVTFILRDVNNESIQLEEAVVPGFIRELNDSNTFAWIKTNAGARDVLINKDDIIKVEIN